LPGLSPETIDKDIHGNVIANSAGRPFEPKTQREFPTLILEAYKYYSTFDMAMALRYIGRGNSNTFTISQFGQVQPGQVRCLMIAPTQDFQEIADGEQPPVEVCHRFEIRNSAVSGEANDPGFRLRVLDKGRGGWYATTDGKKIRGDFTAKNGATELYEPVEDDVLLDGEGMPIDINIGIGTGAQADVKTPTQSPSIYLPESVDVERAGSDKPTWLLFDVIPSVDFTPLVASL
jgi:hypothetical protein